MIWKFRTLLVVQWIAPLVATLVGAAITGGPLPELADPNWGRAVMVYASLNLAMFVLSSVALWQFRAWAPTLYFVTVAVYAVGTLSLGPILLSGFGRLAFLLDGVGLGAITTWLLVARHTLPFPANTRQEQPDTRGL